MSSAEVNALIDRLSPTTISIHWLLDDCYVIADDLPDKERIKIARHEITDVDKLLTSRGYTRVSEEIDPRGGMEGEFIYMTSFRAWA